MTEYSYSGFLEGSDIAKIQNVLNNVMICMDEGDGDAFSSNFSEEAVVMVHLSKVKKVGRSEIGDLFRSIKSKFPTAMHWEGNVRVRREGIGMEGWMRQGTEGWMRLTNKSYWKAVDPGDGPSEIIAMGIHYDTFEPVVVTNIHGVSHVDYLLRERHIWHTYTREGGRIPLPTVPTGQSAHAYLSTLF